MLESRHFGRVRFYPGGRDARWPFSNTLIIEDEVRVAIDPGAGTERLAEEFQRGADVLINTHSHGDHVRGNRHYPHAIRWAPALESHHFGDYAALGRSLGVEAVFGVEENALFASYCSTGEMRMQNPIRMHEKPRSALSDKPHQVFGDGHEWLFGNTLVKAVHIPGHTGGLMCLHFPEERVAFVTDFDLTPFGPWYGQPESDPGAFLASAEKLRQLDVDWFITSHEYGYLSRDEFVRELDRFMAIIPKREERIRRLLHLNELEILREGVIYFKHIVDRDPWINMMGLIMVRKHLHRLGAAERIGGPF